MVTLTALLVLCAAPPPLRVIVRADADEFLEPQGSLVTQELELLAAFAAAQQRPLELVKVDAVKALLPALLDGKGDVVADGLTVTASRQKLVAFTRPTRTVDELVVGLASMQHPPANVAELAGHALVVPTASSWAETLHALPGVQVVEKDGTGRSDALLYELTRGAFDLTVLDDARLASMQTYLPQLKALFPVATGRSIAFALRKEDVPLLEKLDAFLIEHAFRAGVSNDLRDLSEMKKRGTLRVLVRNNAVSFFAYRGNRDGFDYELAKGFAKSQRLMLEVIIAPSYDALIPMLQEGRGDLIAASFTATPEREKAISFSRPYLRVSELFVQKKGAPKLDSFEALRGRTVTVRPSSSYAEKLRALADRYGFTLADAAETDEVEDLLADVAEGRVELTVADAHFFQAEAMFRPTLEAPLKLSDEEAPIAFGVRKENPELLAALDAFVKRVYRGAEYNMLKNRCFGNRAIVAQGHERTSRTGKLSEWDPLIRRYSDQYGFDWRLMSAQAWRESRFNPKAKSFAGALGLFQVMPATGKELGFTQLTNPEQGTHAGIKYMSQLVKRFEPDVPLDERVRFSLAAYNAGLGHVQDARQLAEQLQLDPNVWSGNVEKAMALLSQPRWAKKSRSGFCRCQEPVDYVRVIENKYESFIQLVK